MGQHSPSSFTVGGTAGESSTGRCALTLPGCAQSGAQKQHKHGSFMVSGASIK